VLFRSVKDAESFAAEDHKRREAAEARNQADQLAYTVDKSLGEWGDKVPTADRDELVAAANELKELLKDQNADADALKTSSDKVMGVFSRVGQAMYQNAPSPAAEASASAGGDEAASSEDDEVVEGEIVDEGGAGS